MGDRRATGGERPNYSLRLGRDERAIIEAAADRRGWTLGTYIRRSALDRARRDLAAPARDAIDT